MKKFYLCSISLNSINLKKDIKFKAIHSQKLYAAFCTSSQILYYLFTSIINKNINFIIKTVVFTGKIESITIIAISV
ncbi:hypothetical protein SAMN05443550_101297 [Pedobacter hartonius]|uniref:Uncharacterized protein n=1 Tax=Pedobacter hartonius TaxID=425514 RepID=A0A1H3WKP2_9SPHI|nr:hypothetical protein SAMN05443550_101297 [Pedobacter hartonius]